MKVKGKKWYTSKTLIVNTIFALGILIQVLNKVQIVDPELQSVLIVVANYVLRILTKEKLNFK